jgi:tetratricopeptide (TPR) repeat protein
MTDTGSLLQRARLLAAARRTDEAITLLTRALATDPSDPALLDALASAQIPVDRDAAAKTAARLLALQPDNPRAHNLAATALLDVKGGKQALEHADKSVALAPDVAWYHIIRAEALLRRHRIKAARASADKAIELAPHDPATYNTAGNVELAARRWKKADTWYRQALQLNPNDRPAQLNLVITQKRLGQVGSAFADSDVLLRLDPNDPVARRRLDDVVYTTLLHLQWIAAVVAFIIAARAI